MARSFFQKVLFIAIAFLICLYGDLYPQNAKSIADSNNQFAFELYSKYKLQKNNIFISPYSIYSALGMTYEGAKSKTAQEMEAIFHFPEDKSLRCDSFLELVKQINKENKKYELHVANALWAQQNYKFLQSYFNIVENYYQANVFNINFSASEDARLKINNWVEEKTNRKIKNLIPEGMINKATTVVLTNAIYFKGFWLKQFDKSATKEMDFSLDAGGNVKTQMMHLKGEELYFNYMETDNFQMLELPYSGEELSMIVILPKNNTLAGLEGILNAENLNLWQKDFKRKKVDVFLPKFKFETKYFMKDTLKEMGMLAAFSPLADFSGMTGNRDLFIGQVIHQAFIEVNEEGTEAAAATAVVMLKALYNPEDKTFIANHPFVFLIQEKSTGAILFLGRVNNPNAE